jgi:electron transfer flavoprotein beta subunit
MRRILVLIKQVPTTESVRLDPDTGTMIRSGAEVAINPLDLHAVEQAVRIVESSPDEATITVLSMGPPHAESAIREALALGCDNGVLLCGREFSGADTWATAYALVRGIQRLGSFDLILCGERATDGETGQVGPMVAAMLDIPLLTYVGRLAWEGDRLTADRSVEGGTEHVAVSPPALVCVLRELNSPRLPNLAGKISAHERPIAVLDGEAVNADPALLGLNGSPTRVVNVEYPSFQRSCECLDAFDKGLEAALDHLDAVLEDSVSAQGEDE